MHYIFDLSKDYVLENDCVLLRPLQASDCEHLRYFSQNQPEIWTYSLQKAAGEDNLKMYLEFAVKARERGTEYPFIVFDKKQQAYAGSTRFYDIQLQHQTLQLGFTWYGKEFQGTGLNKHCKFLLLQFAFEAIGMERVEFRADINNKRSIAAMKSIGCVEEGVLRSHANKVEGGRRDSIILSILKDEWFNTVKQNLLQKLSLHV
ncbi:MAG: GNAT family N-acetyltransferase [Sediminibacterium sp. Gen4]|jgi:N-acetyltransferase|uniref:GNAT family N-acetyltransferase n=1 Tax=unclassified Sediminibacterium TaxID=2635961 RepID=UPI0015B847BF|nr:MULTISPECIES: GNAT family protein [unclassified Sediminibacterium]MBW0165771.1 GNAT family N-acetyltransferase [Sediminibacterium sp.]NWK64738.1 GNAT family N-acetyltransferase [Sediminibacterium sp. Gen4]